VSAKSYASSAWLRGLGGELMRLEEGTEVVANYGSVEAECEALVDGVGVIARNWPDHLRVRGEDRMAYLNGKVTCEIDGLGFGEGVYGFVLDAKGHIQADTTIRVLEDAIWLELPAGQGSRLLEHLNRFVVIDRVEIEPLEDLMPLTLVGPQARATLGAVLDPALIPDRPWQIRHLAIESEREREIPVSSDGRWGMPALTLWPQASDAEALVSRLLDAGRPSGARLVGYQALNRFRIEAGIPWFGWDFGEDNLPQETGEDEAVSYTKGCYLGQEVVARLHYRGQVSKLLCGLTIDADEVPGPGTALALDERQAGRVTSATRSPRMGSVVGIAMLQRRAAEVGTRLDVEGGGHARVVKSPLTA
jgi:folate-binding protein YgfZ